jgi:hypothetical protein
VPPADDDPVPPLEVLPDPVEPLRFPDLFTPDVVPVELPEPVRLLLSEAEVPLPEDEPLPDPIVDPEPFVDPEASVDPEPLVD